MEPWFGNHGNVFQTFEQLHPDLLQWSRGSVTTETSKIQAQVPDPVIASMEPWFGNHGNQPAARA